MTFQPRVSVIVLNRDRTPEVGRVLKALTFQTYRDFEVILVSNQVDRLSERFALMEQVQAIPFEPANVAAARNAGLAAASGEILAFCDDDAVPEPEWLSRIIAPFDEAQIGAVGGLVRGRNGVSFQWGPQEVDCFGNDWPLDIPARGQILAPSRPGRVLKTVGTNCAFRREALVDIAGFDTNYHFYLDETDANWRLSGTKWKSLIEPTAEVHHGYTRSAIRTSERVPLSLREIGASKAYFCGQFGDAANIPEELDGFRKAQRARLIRAMELGLMAPGTIGGVLDSLEEGFIIGAQRRPVVRHFRADPVIPKRFCAENPQAPEMLTAHLGIRKNTRKTARELAADGVPVTVFDFAFTAKMLTVRFTDDGYWLHQGGVYGRADRHGPLFRLRSLKGRISEEIQRVKGQRAFL